MDQLIGEKEKAEAEKAYPNLLSPLKVRGITLRNRIMVSPMCQYSSQDGLATDWHLVHLGARAVGGAALVCCEATSVEPAGRISPEDLGIWGEQHILPLARITKFIKEQGAVPGIQLAHAGRKAAVRRPWERGAPLTAEEGAWEVVGPSSIPFDQAYQKPHELSREEITQLVEAFRRATHRSVKAGFEVIELHFAHGYLLHQFLSPLSNQRKDEYGGSFENRCRFPLEVVRAVRQEWPQEFPLFVRISATDWVEGGWAAEDSVRLAQELSTSGVDMLDCSSGGNSPAQKIPLGPSYQVPFAEKIRREAGMPTIAVGLIYDFQQANAIILEEQADLVALARELLRDPNWPLHAAKALGYEIPWPDQYLRAKR